MDSKDQQTKDDQDFGPPNSPTVPPYSSVVSQPPDSSFSHDIAELPGDSILYRDNTDGHEVTVSAQDDGRVEIDCGSRLIRSLESLYQVPPPYEHKPPTQEPVQPKLQDESWASRLNIVIQVVGSRGDVQPFVALGAELKRYGHRVRLATHDMFGDFVRNAGLEFYPIGGDPAELMAYMVKNPGLIPSMESLAAGEIQKKRYMVEEMLENFWGSCKERDPLTDDPFVADAIIANPPSFAHLHCAQALGIPVHLMFTMPWSNTRNFPHPLANLKNVQGDPTVANFMSYDVVEWMTWQGLGDIINKWRRSIDLEEVSMFDGPLLIKSLKIPFTYCWSPALVPKPADWGSHIDVVGFFFREAPKFSPPPDLAQFLRSGPPPVYIGFGSIVLDDPEKFIGIILDAVRATGIRAIISRGWSELAGSVDDNVYWIAECPHEWLFQHVAAVIHHGGAGTTACGLRNSKPTAIIPFFGDQPFWGEMIAQAGAGPRPIRHGDLTVDNLSESIRCLLSAETQAAAASVAAKMDLELGAQAAVRSFHQQLPLENLRCDLIPSQPAVWKYTASRHPIKLSKLAAEIILSKKAAEPKSIKMYKSKTTIIETTRWDPVSGGASAVLATATDLTGHLTGVFTKPVEEWRSDRRRRGRELKSVTNRPPHASVQSLPKDGEDKASLADAASADTKTASSTKSKKGGSLAGRMAGASAMSIVNFAPTALKGMTVDIPLAITEGLRAVPHHYGGSVRDNGRVTGAGSGFVVAGKTFAWGFVDGISDLAVQPYKGAKKEGTLGAVKGLGKGMTSLATKSGAGMFGLFAYTSAGISKSARAAVYTRTRKAVDRQRHEEGQWMIDTGKGDFVNPDEVVSAFKRLRDATS